MNPRALLIPVASVAAILLVLLSAQCERRKANEQIGGYRERIEQLLRDSVARAVAIRRVDSVFTRDTVRLARTLTRWRTRVDSIARAETLTVRESVIVAAADTAIRACNVAVASCTRRVSERDSMIVLLGLQRATDRQGYEARIKQLNPRVLPYIEGHIDAANAGTFNARAGIELRLFAPFRISVAGQYTNLNTNHPLAALVGARVTF